MMLAPPLYFLEEPLVSKTHVSLSLDFVVVSDSFVTKSTKT